MGILEKHSIRLAMLIVLHTFVFMLTLWFSMLLKFEFAIPEHMQQRLLRYGLFVVGAKLGVFYLAGHFHGWYKYVTFSDLIGLVRAALIAGAIVAILDFYAFDSELPRSVVVLDFLLTILAVGALRSVWRLYDEQSYLNFREVERKNALMVVGNGNDARLAHQVNAQKGLGLRVKALVAPGPFRRGARLGHLRIAGTLEKIDSIARKHNATDILIPNNVLKGAEVRALIEKCNSHNLHARILPPLEEALRGHSRMPLRELNINDLLRRDPVELDAVRIGAAIKGKRVLVTGAGGSIGSEICRQLMQFEPGEVVLLGRGENRIFSIDLELRTRGFASRVTPVIADVTDAQEMRRVFERFRPDIVFHAAAHKHVYLMEQHVAEAIHNNAHGTRTVADLAMEFESERFVLISTDKAVNPTSVMGCSKQLAERVLNARADQSKTLFCVVRFGNVLGSNGSVIPIFQEQIRRGGPITVTHKDMTRFFMSIPEASQLVLQAGSMCKGGEVFCLDMGDPIKIVDLARDLVRLSGLPVNSIDIAFVGPKTGEKLYEELYFSAETTLQTEHEKVRAAYQRPYDGVDIDEVVDNFIGAYADADNETLKDMLKKIIPEYQRPGVTANPETNLPLVTT